MLEHTNRIYSEELYKIEIEYLWMEARKWEIVWEKNDFVENVEKMCFTWDALRL